MTRFRLIVGLLFAATTSCSKSPFKFLGVSPGMTCRDFAGVVYPLHARFNELMEQHREWELHGVEGPFVSVPQVESACLNGKPITAATADGTSVEFTVHGPEVSGYVVKIQSWLRFKPTAEQWFVVRGRLVQGDEGQKAAQAEAAALYAPLLGKLGSPVIELGNCPVWRGGEYLFRRCGVTPLYVLPEKTALATKEFPFALSDDEKARLLEALKAGGAKI